MGTNICVTSAWRQRMDMDTKIKAQRTMGVIQDELHKMGIPSQDVSMLQDKDGILVARVAGGESSYVVKCFQNNEYRREIENYRLLAALGVPTIQVIASTASALLLEDLACSPVYRLGVRADLSDLQVARRIAGWYQQLHNQGYAYVRQQGNAMYDETDFFTMDHIAYIKEKTGTQDAPAWRLLARHYDAIRDLLFKTRRTLTYHDFYYTNMAVARDKSSALMFDYNLLGKGYAYSDVRNVLSSLSAEAGKGFLDAYGGFDPTEKALDDVVSVVVTLFLACQHDPFPGWAKRLLEDIDTDFIFKIEGLRDML